MGSANPVVLDISSDEEPDRRGDNLDWLAEVLGVVDERSNGTDEVEVVSEVKGSVTAEHRMSKSWNPTVGNEIDDDDCVVLDGDPDKAAVATAVDDDDKARETDEVFVIGQKGQIACRDFPHPRHSCAKYPFSSTPHEKYCDMCHCYVCDTRAPCAYWCVAVSSIDHCHANDKEETWKSQREYLRTGKTGPLLRPIPRPPATTNLSTVPPHLARPSTRSLIQLAPTSMPQTQVGIRACSSSTGVAGVPSIRARCRFRQSGSVLHNQGMQQRSGHLLGGVRNNVFQKARVPTFGNLRPRVVSSNRMTGTPRVSGGIMVANLSGYGSSNNKSNVNNIVNAAQGLQYTQSSPPLAPPNQWQDVSPSINLEVYTQQCNLQPNLTGSFPATVTSQSHLYARQLGQDSTANDSCWSQTNVDQFAPTEAPHPMADSQPQNFEEVGANSFQQSKLLSEFEDWLMDNLPVPVSPLPEPMGLNEGEFTFDFETFLNS